MTVRRRPIPRCRYQFRQSTPRPSLRYETILGGAVRVYPGGREVCQDNAAGRREYARRVELMVMRQEYRCSLCKRRITPATATFEHERRRGMGAAFRNDAIVDSKGGWVNSASHWSCNGERG